MPTRPPPALAGRFRLLDPVGAGASGRVFRAWDLRERRHVAAKVLPGARWEAQPPAAVDHPHVLRPWGRFADDSLLLEVSELVAGGSLVDLLRGHGRLPEAYVVRLLAQLLDALAAVHAAGGVHGDVKPGNVLLRPTGTGPPYALLADFGGPGSAGTPGFVAPERAAGAPADPSQDVHALGVTARCLLNGAGALTTLLDSMTRPEPERRPTAAAARARLLELPVRRGRPWPCVPDRLSPAGGPRRPPHAAPRPPARALGSR